MRLKMHFHDWYNSLREIKWLIFIFSFIGIFLLGMWGFSIAFQGRPEHKTLTDLAYHSLQLFRTQSGAIVPVNNWQLEWARFLAPLLVIAGALLILLIFIDYIKKFKLHFFTSQHVIICGMEYPGPAIADYFLRKRDPVVIIEKDEKNPELESCREKGAIVYVGDATKQYLLGRAQLRKARHVFAVTGNDTLNAEIAVQCHKMTKRKQKGILTCHVHIVDAYLCDLLRYQTSSRPSDPFRWKFFNMYQVAGYCIQKVFPVFPEKDTTAPDVNVMVVGAGRMGKTLIARSTRKWKEVYGNSAKKITFSVLDRDADTQVRMLRLQYPSILNYCECKGVNLDLRSPDFIEGNYLGLIRSETEISKVFICIDDPSVALSTALTLHRQLPDQNIPIIVRTMDVTGSATVFGALKDMCDGLSNISTFPIASCDCCRDFIIMENRDILGKAIHANYIAQKIRSGADPTKDLAMKQWNELPEYLKESNRLQADDIIAKLLKIHCFVSLSPEWEEELFEFTGEEVEFLAREEHQRWMKERLDEGWVYGETRDPEKKISPYLRSYDELPEEIKEYDRESVRNIPGLLSKIDMRISRFPRVCMREATEQK